MSPRSTAADGALTATSSSERCKHHGPTIVGLFSPTPTPAVVSRAYGLVFTLDAESQKLYTAMGNELSQINGTESWELPIPATYVIDTEGIIRSAAADPDYRKRAEPTDVLETLRSLTHR